MLDLKGIYLDEVSNRYPKNRQMLGYDVLMDTDEFHKPKVIPTFDLCVNSIMTLLLMKPGQYPSIPELGINIEQYLHEYSDDESILTTIMNKLKDQCNRLDMAGIDINCYFNTSNPAKNELIVEVTGDRYITKGMDTNKAIIGITYDKLNQLYLNRYVEYKENK